MLGRTQKYLFLILAFELIEFCLFFYRRFRSQFNALFSNTGNYKGAQEYCSFNRSIFTQDRKRKQNIILMDCSAIPHWIFVNSYLTNVLADRFDAEIVSYSSGPRVSYVNDIYNSFGCRSNLIVWLSKRQRFERWRLYSDVMSKIRSKQDLYDLRLDGVWVGMDIYESILRSGVPTVKFPSLRTQYYVYYALAYYLFFKNVFESGKVSAFTLSHDCYITMGLVSRIAYYYKVPVFFADNTCFTKTTYTHQLYERFRKYPQYFETMTDEEKLSGITWAKDRIDKRLDGVVGVNMTYQEKSAFTANQTKVQTSASAKLKIVVATHCFFDNPHCYGGMLFLDFYEWLLFLGEISEITEYDWYLKSHPDYLPGTLETLSKVCSLYPKLKLIDPATSFHQLKNEGVSVALTCYGSIGHELPLLGYKVINAGYNPHVAYKFNWHAKTLDEYRTLLLSLKNLGEIQDVDDVYKFFFIAHRIDRPSDLLFESFDKYLLDSGGDLLGDHAFTSFLKQKGVFHEKATKNITRFIESKCVYSAECNNTFSD